MPGRTGPCDDCPFWRDRTMHYSLGERRMDEIKKVAETGGYFPCHKTTGRRHDLEAEHGGWENAPMMDRLRCVTKEQQCFGALEWGRTGRYLEDREPLT